MKLILTARRGWWPVLLMALTLLSGGGPQRAGAQQVPRSFLLVVTGSSGEPRFARQFHSLAMDLLQTATTRYGIPDSQAVWLAETTEATSPPGRIAGRSTKAGIVAAISDLATRAVQGDVVMVLLLGHGSSDGTVSRFNIPGADITDIELAGALSKLKEQRVAVINASSASGDFLKTLSAPGRVVITATKSGFERNETLFGEHFVAALTGDGADTDKDGRVSLLEAFAYASHEVERAYESSGRLQTEHSMLDDDGDGKGHTDPGADGPDGLLARRYFLQPASATVASDPRAGPLLAKQARLQAQVDSLRMLKGTLPEDTYNRALEDLLVDLAETARQLRALGVKKP